MYFAFIARGDRERERVVERRRLLRGCGDSDRDGEHRRRSALLADTLLRELIRGRLLFGRRSRWRSRYG